MGDATASPTASYLSDALGELVRAVRRAVDGDPEARATWDEEPGEYRWIFNQTGSETRIRVLGFPEWRAILDIPDENGEVLLDRTCDTVALGRAVALGARNTLEEWGAEGYRARWVEHPFPIDDLEALERLLQRDA